MQTYKSHKTVQAAKITGYTVDGDGYALTFAPESRVDNIPVDDSWLRKHLDDPANIAELVGGYYVRYSDGFTSWSPAKPFETGYTPADNGTPDLISDEELAAKIEASPAPRVTREAIESRIASHAFLQIGETTILCQIVLDNGYSVRGESACVSAENFNPEIGERIAYDNAFNHLWPLFGFVLAEAQYQAQRPGFDKVRAAAEEALDGATI